MSEQGNQPEQKGRPEESDVITLARVQTELAKAVVEELQKMRRSIDQNTQALGELKNVRQMLDQNRRSIDELNNTLKHINSTLYTTRGQ